MTLIEDQGTEAIMEILSLLEGRVKRCGACQISSSTIRKSLRERFGISGSSGAYLQTFVEGFLRGARIIIHSYTGSSKTKRTIIYNIDPKQLQVHLLDSTMINT